MLLLVFYYDIPVVRYAFPTEVTLQLENEAEVIQGITRVRQSLRLMVSLTRLCRCVVLKRQGMADRLITLTNERRLVFKAFPVDVTLRHGKQVEITQGDT